MLTRSTSRPGCNQVDDAVETGATFSSGFPITPLGDVNDRGQGYYGPVVLITDARCYSATDIFAAGFQDHDIGPIVGVAERTGAGGANVWTQFLFRELLPARNNPLKELPRGASFRVAVRRTTRVGLHASELLEDLGVAAKTVHPITDRDLLEDDRDLIEAAVARDAWTCRETAAGRRVDGRRRRHGGGGHDQP